MKDLGAALNICVWSYAGVDSVGQIVEELQDSGKNLVRTILGGMLLTTMTYLISVVGPLSLDTNYENWKEGYFVSLAEMLGGTTFKYFIIAVGMVGNFGQLNALVLPASEQLIALCGPEYLEIGFVQWESSWGVPIPAILLTSFMSCVLMQFINYVELVSLQMMIYSVVVIFICIACIALRITEKGKALHRPYSVLNSDSTVVLCCVCSVPIFVSLLIIGYVSYSDWTYVFVTLGIWFMLFIIHTLCGYRRELRGLKDFQDLTKTSADKHFE